MSDEELDRRYAQVEPLAERIAQSLQREIDKLGFADYELELLPPADAIYRLEKDTASGEYSLIGDWLNDMGLKMGTLVFHADGSFFAEQDIVLRHPLKPRWFVEAVNAWGKGEEIKAEARLLALPE
ncbi:MAG: hypothetical protein PVG66_09460 [Chromatiales bacterium]